MGEVWEQAEFEWPVEIENCDPQLTAQIELAASCDCTAVSPSRMAIPPGERGRVLLDIDLTFPPHAAAQFERAMDIRVLARSRDAGRPRLLGDWHVRGLVRRHLAVRPPAIDFSGADELVEGVKAPTATLHIRPLAPVASLSARVEPEIGTAVVTLQESDYEISLSGIDTLETRAIDAEIVLTAVSPTREKLPEFRVPVRGRIVSKYVVTPRMVTFAPTNIGDEVSTTVQIASRDDSPMVVELPEGFEPGLSAEILPADAPTNLHCQDVLVRLKVDSSGNIQRTLPLLARPSGGGAAPRRLSIIVRGFGLDAHQRIVTRP